MKTISAYRYRDYGDDARFATTSWATSKASSRLVAVLVSQAAIGFNRGQLPDLMFGNTAAHDLHIATLRVANQLRAVAAPDRVAAAPEAA